MADILAIIPARGNSKTIKNKNIVNLNNKPLISYTIDAALKSRIFKNIVVSTDSLKIKKISEKYGAEVPFIRAKNLSLDSTPSYPVILDTYKKIKKIHKIDYKYICVLQPTSPFRNHIHIKEAFLKLLDSKNADSLISCQKVPHNFHPKKLMNLKNNGFGKIKDLNKLNNINRHGYEVFFARNGSAIYFTTPEILKKSLLGKRILFYEMNKVSSLDIDDHEDLEIADSIARNY